MLWIEMYIERYLAHKRPSTSRTLQKDFAYM